MSRPLRIDFPGSWHHVMNRGRRREPIFHSSGDANKFLELVGEAGERFGIETHVYCLMTNHYHLLVRSVDGTLSRAMRHIDGVYAQAYNWRHGHDGPLFRGRFRSLLVDSERYLAAVATYIHRNPLDAGMVDHLSDHRWSSYPSYLGRRRPEKWLKTDVIRTVLPERSELRRMTERLPLPDEVETFYSRPTLGPVLGDEAFRAEALRRVEAKRETAPQHGRINAQLPIEQVIWAVASEFGVDTESISSPSPGRRNIARSVAIFLATDHVGLPLGVVADRFGMSGASGADAASRLVRQLREQDPNLDAAVRRLVGAMERGQPLEIET